jgi:exopolyphosphatase / guanosine-5'-triphosphate,3'-diphosphate pyrophosphatase
MTVPRAAVDVGSNSVRLLVMDGGGERVTRQMTVTRLAEGVDRTGHLDDVALERTIDTITRYREIWTSHGVRDRVRIAATSAVRDASDRDRFFAAVRAATGVDAEVLSGEQEAGLSFRGATGAVEASAPTAVVDIGGGSTELIVGTADGEVGGSVSLQLGCVRLTERLLHHDPVSAGQLVEARALVAHQLAVADHALASQGVTIRAAAAMIGVAGTATTLGALYLGLDDYVEEAIHGARVPAAAIVELATDLTAMSVAKRAALGPMQPGRAEVIHGGALVLAGIVAHYDLEEVIISESDSLDGLVASLGPAAA